MDAPRYHGKGTSCHRVSLNGFLKHDETQSGPQGETICCSGAGMGVGSLEILGFKRRYRELIS